MNDWHDLRQIQTTLTPTDNRPPDHNLYCYRPSGELYVVVPPSKWKRLREQGKLDSLSKAIRADIQCKQEQTMSTAKVVQIGSEGERAFARVKPLLDVLRNNTKKAAAIVSKEYSQLQKLEKAVFAANVTSEYGWSQDRLGRFALIGREFPAKQQLISSVSRTAKIDDLDITSMYVISGIDNKVLKAAAAAGVFDMPITTRELTLMRKTGALPTDLVKHVTKTELQKIQSLMADAKSYIDRASLRIAGITAIMEDNDIINAKGKEATALIASFEKLCTKMATANPVTSKRAFAILRGEA